MSRRLPTDLMKLRKEIKDGTFEAYVNRGKAYLKDVESGETIMICEVKENASVQHGYYPRGRWNE